MSAELQKRVLTAFLGGAPFLALIIYCGWVGVFFITNALALGMIFEFSSITFSLKDQFEKRYALLVLTWVITLVNLLIPQAEFFLLFGTFISLFTYFLWTAGRFDESDLRVHFKELMYSVFGMVYVVFNLLFLSRIYNLSRGTELIILFFVIVWTCDSGAYFFGKRFGKRKLYPKISPGKTWEGSLGGMFLSVLSTLIYKALFYPTLSISTAFFLPLSVGFTSQIGDLCESFFKRAFNKKDSGVLLPGHGGFLDRFDGVVFSLPVMYACIRLLG